MNEERLESGIKSREGYRAEPYRCTENAWTCGWGHNISRVQLRDLMPYRTMGSVLDMLSDLGNHERWFKQDLLQAEIAARRYIGDRAFDALSDRRQECLVEMGFQLGSSGLEGFVKMRPCIMSNRWIAAAEEIENSRLHLQTPSRSKFYQDCLIEG